MTFFDSPPGQGRQFLDVLAGQLDLNEFDGLGMEAGFVPPNDFPVEALLRVLSRKEFPHQGFYDYMWAIYECGYPRLRTYSIWMRTYLAALYVYCNKRQQWGITVDSDYYYLVVDAAVQQVPETREATRAFLNFLEWLEDWVPCDVGYDDYYCLLAWTLLRRASRSADHRRFQDVLRRLLDKRYSADDLQQLTVAERGVAAWFELHQKTPCPPALRADFEAIVCGTSAK